MNKNIDKFKDNLIVKSNELIEASYALTINEQRLLLSCISQIDSRVELTSSKEFIITVEQAQDLFYSEENRHNIYRDLISSCKKLFNREVKIKLDEKKFLHTRFVQSVEYHEDEKLVKLLFAEKILPYISELKKNFTKYRLKNIVELTSIYAVRIYELIVSWGMQENFTYKKIEISEFRQLLKIENKYSEFSSFNAYVITPAVEQINKFTDFNLEVGFIKKSRTYRWITFSFVRKKAESRFNNEKIQNIENKPKYDKKIETNNTFDWENLPIGSKFQNISTGEIFIKKGKFGIYSEKDKKIFFLKDFLNDFKNGILKPIKEKT